MRKVYVVVKRGYEYNDQTYDMAEGGNPERAFSTHEAAQKAASEMSLEFAKEWVSSYYSDLSAFSEELYDNDDFTAMSLEEQLKYLNSHHDIWFYGVKEVELED